PDISTDSQARCTALLSASQGHRHITGATWTPAHQFQAPDGRLYDTPAFCRVEAISRPTADSEIHFEVWLPAPRQWNGRYYQHGEGHMGGDINYAALAGFVREGIASAATDDGHESDFRDFFAVLRDHPQKFIDNQYRALKETSDGAREVIAKFYSRGA